MQCCQEELADEYLIAQNVVDAIEDCSPTHQSLSRVCSRISYAADTIDKGQDSARQEVLGELKRFALLVYQNKERILDEKEILSLVCSFVQVVKSWFTHSVLKENFFRTAENHVDSIKADLAMLEMALGFCVLMPACEEDLDAIFF